MDYRAGGTGLEMHHVRPIVAIQALQTSPCPAQMFNLTLIIRNFANGSIWCEDNSVDSVVSLKKNWTFC